MKQKHTRKNFIIITEQHFGGVRKHLGSTLKGSQAMEALAGDICSRESVLWYRVPTHDCHKTAELSN